MTITRITPGGGGLDDSRSRKTRFGCHGKDPQTDLPLILPFLVDDYMTSETTNDLPDDPDLDSPHGDTSGTFDDPEYDAGDDDNPGIRDDHDLFGPESGLYYTIKPNRG